MSSGKKALRRLGRRRRGEHLEACAAPVLAQVRACLPQRLAPGRLLGLYWPMASELDLRPLAEDLPGRLALPAVITPAEPGGAAALHFRRWQPKAPLAPDHCGIPSPAEGPNLPAETLGLLLVPALAFDPRSGIRLGYGGGWYDRLRADPLWRRVPALVVLPAACLLDDLPHDPWDVPFDGWIDETGLHPIPGRKIATS